MRIYFCIICFWAVSACTSSDKLGTQDIDTNNEGAQTEVLSPSVVLTRDAFTFESSVRQLVKMEGRSLEDFLENGMQSQLNRIINTPSPPYFMNGIVPQDLNNDSPVSDYSIEANGFWLIGASQEAVFSGRRELGVDIWSGNGNGRLEQLGFAGFAGNGFYQEYVEEMHYVDGRNPYLFARQHLSNETTDDSVIQQKLSAVGALPLKSGARFRWYNFDELLVDEVVEPELELDIDVRGGRFIKSHRRGDTLYVVTNHWFWHDFLHAQADAQAQFDHIALQEYFPVYVINGSKRSFSPECISEAIPGPSSLHSINVTAIDMRNGAVLSNQCVQAAADGVHFIRDSLFITVSRELERDGGVTGVTDVYEFALSDTVRLRASGSVPGVVHRSAQGRFAAKTTEAGLYLVTTQRDSNWNPLHGVYEVVSLDGDIGYRGARVSVDQELGEGVTFLAGGVVLPSQNFSPVAYMPMSASKGPGKLSLLNYEVDENRFFIALNDQYALALGSLPALGGFQMSLIIKDELGGLTVADTLIVAGERTTSSAIYDLREVLINDSGQQLEFVIPIAVYGENPNVQDWTHTELMHVRVGPEGLLHVLEELVVEDSSTQLNDPSWLYRGLVTGSGLHYISNGHVYTFAK